MSSPNEPGHPRAGDGPGPANGSGAGTAASGPDGGSRPAHTAESGDVPPWQRGPAARARQQQAPDSPTVETAPPRPGGGSPGLDARLNRFMGGAAGSTETDKAPRNDRTEVTRTDAKRPDAPTRTDQGPGYASELPDLSGPRPPQPQRKPAERPATEAPRPAKAAQASPPAANRGVQVTNRPHRGPVRASMQIRRVDPWSTLKVSLLLSVVLFFVWMIAVAFLYLVLGGMGVWSKLNSNVGDLLTSASGSSGGELVSSGTIFGGAALIGLVNIVLMTAAATLGAFIYNLTTDLVGGVEVTLADRD